MKVETFNTDSPQWKEITKGREVIRRGRCLNVGKGDSIQIQTDPWIPLLPEFTAQPRDQDNINVFTVNELIIDIKRDENTIWDQFDSNTAEAILKIKINPIELDDRCVWVLDRVGNFTVKSVYRLIHNDRDLPPQKWEKAYWKALWKIKAPRRLKMLLWKISHGAIPTRDILKNRMDWIDDTCPLCHQEVETRVYCLFQCQVARLVWSKSMGLRTEAHISWGIDDWL